MTAYPEGGYIGFYPSKPVWVGKALPETARQPEGQFRWDAMAEIELSRAIPGTELHICRDGLIILRIEELQEGISKAMRSPPLSVWESAGPLLNRYLGHCNTLRLLLEAGLWKHDRLGMGTTPIRKGEALLLDFRHQMLVGNTIPEGEGADLIRQRIPGSHQTVEPSFHLKLPKKPSPYIYQSLMIGRRLRSYQKHVPASESKPESIGKVASYMLGSLSSIILTAAGWSIF